MIKLTCDNCSKFLLRSPSRVYEHNFCDMKCYSKWRKENPEELPGTIKPNLSINPNLLYVLGVLRGDGSVGKYTYKGKDDYSIRLRATDKPFVDSFVEAIMKIGLNPYTTYHREIHEKWSDYWTCQARSRLFYDWYVKRTIPQLKELIGDSDKLKISFIRGLYESDGGFNPHKSFDKRRGRFYVKYVVVVMAKSDKELIIFTKEMVEELGFHPWIGHQENPSGVVTYKIVLSRKREVKKFLEEVKPCIPRKKWHEIG